MKRKIKEIAFRLVRKDPEAVVVSFCTGNPELERKMLAEVRDLLPGRRHYVVFSTADPRPALPPDTSTVELTPGSAWHLYRQLRSQFRGLRVGMAPILFAGPRHPLRRAAFWLAPHKILAYNERLERHHLRPGTWIASLLFLRGVPVDRIFLRPRWLAPWKKDRSVYPAGFRVMEGRELSAARRRIAVLSPYCPYPLSHGGAVRIFHLLREAAREYDLFLFAFSDREGPEDCAPLLEFCARVVLVGKTRYREPLWSTLRPPEVHEFDSPALHRALAGMRREFHFDLLQIEYTQLAGFGGDILVEHDVTFDLYEQVFRRRRSLSALWNFLRWRRYELTVLPRFRRIVVMSAKDRGLLGQSRSIREIPNGVDLQRFRPEPETPGQRLLFIGSFRHFPNIAAYRFFAEEVWPRLRERFPQMTLTAVCGPEHLLYWRQFTATQETTPDPRIRLLGFVSDVRPLYVEANLVIVPTPVSAGTNVKALEAMAMKRAMVSTTPGCAGLGLAHGASVWIADDAGAFADGVASLIADNGMRSLFAAAARQIAERNFDWTAIGERQRQLYRELLEPPAATAGRRRRHRHPVS